MKTRPETRYRKVPETIDGVTELVDEPYTVNVPVPPADWDRIVLAGTLAAAILVSIASVTWTTASIGDLLDRAVPAPAAYGAAAVFDLAWITCMAAEWLARYDDAKALLPRRAGYAALAAAMAAVGVHGWLLASLWVGLVGAAVSALAKGMWTVVLRHYATPLDDRTRQWLVQQQSKAGARLAVAAMRRQVIRVDGQLAAELEARKVLAHPEDAPAASPDAPQMREAKHDASQDAPQVTPFRRSTEPVTKTAAILAAASALQGDASPASIAHLLAQQGLAVDTAYVRTVLSRAAKGDGVGKGGGGYA